MTHRGYSLVMKMEQTKLIALKRTDPTITIKNKVVCCEYGEWQ